MNRTAEEIAKEILYLPVTDGQDKESIAKGMQLIEAYANQSKWIDVKVELPKIDAQYNVCYKMANGKWHIFTCGYSVSFKSFDFGNSNITHWQPLPEAP